MTIVIDKVTEFEDFIIGGIANVKEPVTNAVSTLVGFVTERVTEVPAVPFAEYIPTPKEVIDNQAKFATKVVSASKEVAISVAKAAQPLTDQLLDRKSSRKAVKNVDSVASSAA
jgi:hypothetical protein